MLSDIAAHCGVHQRDHVCTVYSQRALIVHHDLFKLQEASEDSILSHALKLDLMALNPAVALAYPDFDTWLAG